MTTMQGRIMERLTDAVTQHNRVTKMTPHLTLVIDHQDTDADVLYVQIVETFESLVVCSIQFWSESVLMVYGSTKRDRDKHPVHGNFRQPKDNRWHVPFTNHVGLNQMFDEFFRRINDALTAWVGREYTSADEVPINQ